MSLPQIREKGCHNRKQTERSYLESSSTLLVDEEAPSLLFVIFLSPLSIKSLFAGERFGMYNSTYNATVDN